MKRCIVFLALALMLSCGVGAVGADETRKPPPAPSVESSEKQKPSDDEAKKQAEREAQARAEAEKRKRIESRHHRHGIHSDSDDSSSESTVFEGSGGPHVSPFGNSFGLVFAPAGASNGRGAVGLVWLNRNHWGAAAWFSGRLQQGDDVIDASIPGALYHVDEKKGSYGIRYLQSLGSDSCSLILGAGVSVEQTIYTDVSDVTGWKWDGGESSTAKLAAQAGLRIRLAPRVSMHLGYDTLHYAFFGLSGDF